MLEELVRGDEQALLFGFRIFRCADSKLFIYFLKVNVLF